MNLESSHHRAERHRRMHLIELHTADYGSSRRVNGFVKRVSIGRLVSSIGRHSIAVINRSVIIAIHRHA